MIDFLRRVYKQRKLPKNSQGFILPVVIALALGITTVGVTTLQTISNSSTTLDSQYYRTLAKEAASAGISAASACIKAGTTTWTNAKPLKPKTDCFGTTATTGLDYVSKNDNWESTFSVNEPVNDGSTLTITSVGTVTLKTSTGTVIQTFKESVKSTGRVGGRTSKSVVSLSTSYAHVCAAAEGKAYCWGWNASGQLGDGTTNNSGSPVAVSESVVGLPAAPAAPAGCGGVFNPCTTPARPAIAPSAIAGKNVTAVAAGTNHTCAIAEAVVYCWGKNNYGQLGNNTTIDSPLPAKVYMNTIAIPATPALPSGCGGIFNPCTTPATPAVPAGELVGKTPTSITAGRDYTCVVAYPNSGTINDSRAYCWGLNVDGQLGVNDKSNRLVPTSVYATGATPAQSALPAGCGAWNNPCTTPAQAAQSASVLYGKTITQITAGDEHTCVVMSDGAGACWGQDTSGQIGSGQTRGTSKGFKPSLSCTTNTTSTEGTTPGDIPDVVAPKLIHVRDSYSYTDIFGTRTIAASPLFGKKIISLDASGSYTNALADDGRIYWWGGKEPRREMNFDQGFITCRNRKTSSPPCAKGESSCYVNEREYHSVTWYTYDFDIHDEPAGPMYQDTYRCWVFFTCSSNNLLTNKQLKAISGSANLGTFCALDMAGIVYCDGGPYNPYYGQLGDGVKPIRPDYTWNNSTNPLSEPTRIDQTKALSGKVITSMQGGRYGNFTCVIANEAVYCWGFNGEGEIGDGTIGTANSKSGPTAVDISGPLGKPGGTSISNLITF